MVQSFRRPGIGTFWPSLHHPIPPQAGDLCAHARKRAVVSVNVPARVQTTERATMGVGSASNVSPRPTTSKKPPEARSRTRFVGRGAVEQEFLNLLCRWQLRHCHLTLGGAGLHLGDLSLRQAADHPLGPALPLHRRGEDLVILSSSLPRRPAKCWAAAVPGQFSLFPSLVHHEGRKGRRQTRAIDCGDRWTQEIGHYVWKVFQRS